MFGKRRKKVWWFEPRWSYQRAKYLELKEAFSPRSWLRILVASFITTILIAMIVVWQVPNLQFNWLAMFARSVGGIVVLLLFLGGLMLLIPSMVGVSHKGVQIQWGESVRFYKDQSIEAFRVILEEDGRVNLWFATDKICRRVGVSHRVRLHDLLEVLGERATIISVPQRDGTASEVDCDALETADSQSTAS